ncbi:helix-turn-helix transcriptional regulator [Micromonospora sp. PPF5-17]|uniref:XRE family transcriptional regulator n=2 Tax=Micromonosporaceae TaxID=28056 RepID=A0ABX9W905_9ACTN|nr:helix-turn-helix domain-containing protein [Micromonospora solifontis]NES15813.1 helix-turn-helix transcriptional regulator [Micromonospora sp. PPF5-17B]NES39487.1 helix-turn-helix transcriptional regulator [Micromonospora solifontis]NES57236.1 helix-turn-helix transcriptional regulator [Micromonospora sp. PPF5-6]RNL88664.1 XRE family transcriptional regulator [Micromonospora solifontis]
MGTPLGDFVRAKRDSIQPESFGLPDHGRRRSPGLRRSDVAARAGISVEYLTRIEQGRDRNPSPAVVKALADALSLDARERSHLRYLVKITGGECAGHRRPAPPNREVRPTALATLRLLEPAAAFVTNRLGDVLAYTSGFELVVRGLGLLDTEPANLTRYVFTDPRARRFLPEWDQVADEQAFDLWLGPSAETAEWFRAELAPVAGPEFTRRLNRQLPPAQVPLRIDHPTGHELRWHREKLELPSIDAQQLVVLLPADEATAHAVEQLRHRPRGHLRSAS